MELSPQKFVLTQKEKAFCLTLIAIGVVTFIAGLLNDPQRAWANYLVEYFFWLCIGLGGIFFGALQYLSNSRWSASVRRIGETFIGFIPVALVLFIGLLFGLHDLFEWTHTEVVAADHLLHEKAAYLNVPFFIIRHGLLYACIFLVGGLIIKNSIKQDTSGDTELTKKNVKLAAIFMILFGWLFTFASIDLMKSLSPHWFSTIFGVYCWAGLFTSGMAMMTVWGIKLAKRGPLTGLLNVEHRHDLGKLLFGFTVFWGYVGFSQYMLIWYGNLPEETFYYLDRMKDGWNEVSIALMIIKFGFPFFALIGAAPKRNEKWLYFISIWIILAHWLDIYWMVFPTFFETPVFGWMEIGMFAGFAGLFFLSVGTYLSKVNPVAVKDPFMAQAMHYHN